MEVETECFRCPYCVECKKRSQFKKIMELKEVSLVIYRHEQSVETQTVVDDKKKTSQNTPDELSNNISVYAKDPVSAFNNIIIMLNTGNDDITTEDFLPEFDKNKLSCLRCRYIMEHTKLLIGSVPIVKKSGVRGICNHCRLQQLMSTCGICDKVVRKFTATKKKVQREFEKDKRKEEMKTTLEYSVKSFQSLKTEKKVKETYSDIDINKITRDDQSVLYRPEVEPLLFQIEQSTTVPVSYLSNDLNKRDQEPKNVEEVTHENKRLKPVLESHVSEKPPIKPVSKKLKPAIKYSLRSLYRHGDVPAGSKKNYSPILRRVHSDESLITSFTAINEKLFKNNFKYFFPKIIKREEKIVISSSELLKDTLDRLNAEGKEKLRKQKEMRELQEKEKMKKKAARLASKEITKNNLIFTRLTDKTLLDGTNLSLDQDSKVGKSGGKNKRKRANSSDISLLEDKDLAAKKKRAHKVSHESIDSKKELKKQMDRNMYDKEDQNKIYEKDKGEQIGKEKEKRTGQEKEGQPGHKKEGQPGHEKEGQPGHEKEGRIQKDKERRIEKQQKDNEGRIVKQKERRTDNEKDGTIGKEKEIGKQQEERIKEERDRQFKQKKENQIGRSTRPMGIDKGEEVKPENGRQLRKGKEGKGQLGKEKETREKLETTGKEKVEKISKEKQEPEKRIKGKGSKVDLPMYKKPLIGKEKNDREKDAISVNERGAKEIGGAEKDAKDKEKKQDNTQRIEKKASPGLDGKIKKELGEVSEKGKILQEPAEYKATKKEFLTTNNKDNKDLPLAPKIKEIPDKRQKYDELSSTKAKKDLPLPPKPKEVSGKAQNIEETPRTKAKKDLPPKLKDVSDKGQKIDEPPSAKAKKEFPLPPKLKEVSGKEQKLNESPSTKTKKEQSPLFKPKDVSGEVQKAKETSSSKATKKDLLTSIRNQHIPKVPPQAPNKAELDLLNKTVIKQDKIASLKLQPLPDPISTKPKQNVAIDNAQKDFTTKEQPQKQKDEQKSPVVDMKNIKVQRSQSDLILKLVKTRTVREEKIPVLQPLPKVPTPKRKLVKQVSSISLDDSLISKSELSKESSISEVIFGDTISKKKYIPKKVKKLQPSLFKSAFTEEGYAVQNATFEEKKEYVSEGVIRYALSDRKYINNGWTVLPTEKLVRRMNFYRMRPAHPEFDWFEHNKCKGVMQYDTGEKLAEFNDNGHGRWYYRNGRVALDYYGSEEPNSQQRFVIYSSGEPDNRGRCGPVTVLGIFDYKGNGVVFDHNGKIRLKYTQDEGVILDRAIGPVSHWKWHSLNDPPVLQQVMIDGHMQYQDPKISQFAQGDGRVDPRSRKKAEVDPQMASIEFENYIKSRPRHISETFTPYQIKMKALKINEQFSLRILDQASIYLLYRDGSRTLKLNLGMVLDQNEIVDTNFAEIGEVGCALGMVPAPSASVEQLQRLVASARQHELVCSGRERRVRPQCVTTSVDRLTAPLSRPLHSTIRTLSDYNTNFNNNLNQYRHRKPLNTSYCVNRLI